MLAMSGWPGSQWFGLCDCMRLRPTPECEREMVALQDKFRGCLLGAAVGDIVGAVVEAESPGYISNTYHTIDDILQTPSVPEFTGPDWQLGRFTDATQITISVP